MAREPRTPDDWLTLSNQIDTVFGQEPPAGPLGVEEVDGVLLVAAWFRRHPEELGRTLAPATARELCRRELSPVGSPG